MCACVSLCLHSLRTDGEVPLGSIQGPPLHAPNPHQQYMMMMMMSRMGDGGQGHNLGLPHYGHNSMQPFGQPHGGVPLGHGKSNLPPLRLLYCETRLTYARLCVFIVVLTFCFYQKSQKYRPVPHGHMQDSMQLPPGGLGLGMAPFSQAPYGNFGGYMLPGAPVDNRSPQPHQQPQPQQTQQPQQLQQQPPQPQLQDDHDPNGRTTAPR